MSSSLLQSCLFLFSVPNLTNGVLKTEAEEIGGQALLKKDTEESVAPSPAGQEYFIKCPQCQKGCQSFQTLKEHMEQVHPEGAVGGVGGEWKGAVLQTPSAASPIPGLVGPGGPYGCSQCSTSFASKDQLEKHELLHSPNAQVVSTSSTVYGFLMPTHDKFVSGEGIFRFSSAPT